MAPVPIIGPPGADRSGRVLRSTRARGRAPHRAGACAFFGRTAPIGPPGAAGAPHPPGAAGAATSPKVEGRQEVSPRPARTRSGRYGRHGLCKPKSTLKRKR